MTFHKTGKIKVKSILTFTLLFSLLYRALVDYVHIFSACRYIIDLCLILLAWLAIKEKKKLDRNQKIILKYVLVYFLFCVIAYIFHFQSIIYLLYGAVYRFRYYCFAILCLIYYKKDDIEKMCKYLDVFFYINAVITFYQYYICGIYGDYLGGLFGNVQGCNAYSNLFLIVTLSISCIKYLEKKEKLGIFGLKILICLIIAAVAELKFFFLEFLVLLLFAILFTGFSWKKFFMAIGSFVGLFIGVLLFTNVYSYGRDFLSVDVWIKLASSGGYSGGYGGIGEVNRLTFATIIIQRFLTDPIKLIFGLGLGNCSYSSIDIFNTPFYESYYTIRYEWFTSSHTLLEQGWIGFALYIGFFALILGKAAKQLKKKNSDRAYCYIAMIMSVMGIILMIYNNSLTMESGFLLYFVCVLPFMKTDLLEEIRK